MRTDGSDRGHRGSAHQHIYVVVRLDFDDNDLLCIERDAAKWPGSMADGPVPSDISGTRAYWDIDKAWGEANRLNELNGPKCCHYFVMLARVADQPTSLSTTSCSARSP